MFSNLQIKKKLYLLFAGVIFMLLLVYVFAIKSTLELRSSCNKLNERIAEVKNAPIEIQLFTQKIAELDKLIKKQDSSQVSSHLEFLSVTSNFCNKKKLIIKDYPSAHDYQKGKYTIETNYIRIDGEYAQLLKLLYDLELKYRNGHISSVSFESVPDYRNDIYKLNLLIYEQNIFENAVNTGR